MVWSIVRCTASGIGRVGAEMGGTCRTRGGEERWMYGSVEKPERNEET
jgi:hypothetical protein